MTETNQRVDQALLQRIAAGDETAKEEMVRKYLPMVRYLVHGFKGGQLDQDDLCQEGFIGLLKAIEEYDTRFTAKFSTFAYLCIKRRISNSIKHVSARGGFPQILSLNMQLLPDGERILQDLIATERSDPLEILIEKWSEQRLFEVLRLHLTPVEFAVVGLILQGIGPGEMQARMGLPAKVIDNARTRARLKLRRLIERYGSLLHPGAAAGGRRRMDIALRVRMDA